MSLLKMLMEAQNGQGLGQIARQIGLDETQAGGLVGMLGPAISQGAKRRAQSGGLEQVLGQLRGEGQAAYLDEPVRAVEPEGQAQGAQFLEQIFGDRQASDDLAASAALDGMAAGMGQAGFDMGEAEEPIMEEAVAEEAPADAPAAEAPAS